MPWFQGYDPLNQNILSTVGALLPAGLLLLCLSVFKIKATYAAAIGLGVTFFVAIGLYHMPTQMAVASTFYGMAYGFLPVGWIILNVIFLYQLCQLSGLFQRLQDSLSGITRDRRLQVLLIPFAFGAFLEGTAGFSTPVAVTASIMAGLGFPPIQAATLALVANTAPVPYAGLGTPIIALQAVTGLDLLALSGTVAWELLLFDLVIPFVLVWMLSGWNGVRGILPAIIVTGSLFGTVQVIAANLHGPWLVNILSSLSVMLVLVVFIKRWQPGKIWLFPGDGKIGPNEKPVRSGKLLVAWLPWLFLSLVMFIWGLPQTKSWLDLFTLIRIEIPGLHGLVYRTPPIVAVARVEPAVFDFNWLSASGTAILIASVLAGFGMKFSFPKLVIIYGRTIKQVWNSLITIMLMMAIGFVTRYSGMDATIGMALARTGAFFPFFSAILGWLGVFLTGSDTSSNVLFGSLQKITAEKLGFNPVELAAANSSGGVMGKMISPQNLVVAAASTGQEGKEGEILRILFRYSLALVLLAGLLIWGISHI
jgi:lactate permease